MPFPRRARLPSPPKPRPNRDAVLAAMPGSQEDLMASTGLSATTVSRWLRSLRSLDESHIGAWRRSGKGPYTGVHHAGPGPDVVCELVVSRYMPVSETARDLAYEAADARHRAALVAESASWVRRDPMVAALFGPAEVSR